MRIGIVGGGAVGLLFAYYMQQSGMVTLYTRTEDQAALINEKGITCVRDGTRDTVFPRASVWGQVPLQDDYLFIAVKQYDIPSIVGKLSKANSRLVFLQNGMTHIELLEHLRQPTAVGIVEHGAKREDAATVVHTGQGLTRLGILQEKEAAFAALLPLFSEAFPLQQEQDWEEVLRNKLVVNVCINPLTALYGVENGELLRNPHFQAALKQLFAEVMLGLDIHEKEAHWQRVCGVCERTAANTSSMLADLGAGRETEVDAIVGYVLKKAEAVGKHVPLLTFLYQSIKGKEG